MKNKNLVSILAIALFALFSVTLTSCGDESEDPTPTKTDLQKVQEAVEGSIWSLVDASVDYDGSTYSYVGASCDFSQFNSLPAAVKTNIIDFEYTFNGTNLSYEPMNTSCGTQTGTYPYTVTQLGDKYVISYNHGGSSALQFEIQNDVEDMEDAEISVKLLTLKGGATEVLLTFARQ